MKFLKYLIAVLLVGNVYGQTFNVVRNDDAATIIQSNNLGNSKIATDDNGVVYTRAISPSGLSQSVIGISNATSLNGLGAVGVGYQFVVSDAVEAASTTTVINATAHVGRVGDAVSFRTGTAGNIGTWSTVIATTANSLTLSNALPATPAAADNFFILRPQPLSVTANNGSAVLNALNVAISTDGQPSQATGILKVEDTPAVTGDALVATAGVANNNETSLAANGDYLSPALTTAGVQIAASVFSPDIGTVRQTAKLEDSASASGDAGVFGLGVMNETFNSQSATANDYVGMALDRAGSPLTTLVLNPNITSTSFQVPKAEDSAAVSGDAGVATLGVINSSLTSKAADGDYTAPALTTAGVTISSPVFDPAVSGAFQATTREDSLFGSGDAGMAVLYQTQDPLTVDQSTNGDAANPKVDRAGRTITTMSPATEMFQACSGVVTNTTSTVIKSGIASTRIYPTSISCSNTSAVASQIAFGSDSSPIYVGYVPANGGFTHTLPVPLRTGVFASFTFQPATTATATTCCAAGYISVN